MAQSFQIVQLAVSQQVASAPSALQSTGALISQGGTTLASGTRLLLTQLSDLTTSLAAARAISGITWASSVATVTTAAAHGYTVGDVVPIVISGVTPAGYNGTFNCTITTTTAFTYPLVANPGSETVPGVYLLADEGELASMATTFFAQGSNQAIYVLELGEGTAAEGVTALSTYITANPGIFYAYVVPREWDGVSSFLTLLATFEALTSKTYFFITTTAGTYTSYTAAMKCAFTLVQAPGATEFSAAAPIYKLLNYAPSPTNKVTPFAYSYMYGVTPYPPAGNGTILASYKTANVNVIGTGAEGGISNSVLFYGTTQDGSDFTYWYSVDWMQIYGERDLAAAVINGSNNPLAPLYYDQPGINTLLATAQRTVTRGIQDGLIQSAVVSAIDFMTYTTANPTDYQNGIYNGISVTFTPNRGFKSITLNLAVSNIPLQ